MERDWYRRIMLKLTDVRDTRPDEYLQALDSELDEVALRLDEARKAGAFTAFTLRRGLNLLTDLRSRLEVVRNGHEIRQAFMDSTELENLLVEALANIDEKNSS